MVIHIQALGAEQFSIYGAIPNWFEVTSVFHVTPIDQGLGGFQIVEQQVAQPYIRHYGDDTPKDWADSFDISRWGIFLATDDGGHPIGGATVALDSPVYPIDQFQRDDLAVLWDIRVHPEYRRHGVGTQLFRYAADWARAQGYGQLGLETDSSNVRACRFYARQGCTLGAIHRFGYIGVPDVAQYAMLLWYVDLDKD